MKVVHFLLLSVGCVSVTVNARPRNDHEWMPVEASLNERCGYKSCPVPDPNKLNIHLVPHSHDDVGWLKTVDQYYYGSKTSTQKAGVQYILDSVVHELLKDPKRKFIYVETAFFFKWWEEQTAELQQQVKELVNEGRLEFAGGAWSMNDEGATHYQSIIDQFALGLKLLNETFGVCGRPRVGWQIDPFGHSRQMASIFAQMGFDGMFFARLDYEDKTEHFKNKNGEMIWHGSEYQGESSDLFTGILYKHYGPPPGFCFDVLCSDDPIIDGKHSRDNNVANRTSEFVTYVMIMSQFYRTKNLLVPMGDDFNYQDATMWFKNLDKLIKYTNELYGDQVQLFYSTPSCYLKALHDANVTWPTKKYDFFPYSTDPHTFWSGYFTSRPTLKRFERVGNHFLQVCKQLTTEGLRHMDKASQKSLTENLNLLREVMGVMQHHDAITGTEKEHVAYDYALQLDAAIKTCHKNVEIILNKATTKINGPQANFKFESCFNLNISQCEVSEKSEKFMVTLYNPLSYTTEEYIRIPVPDGDYEVRNDAGNVVQSQLVPIPTPVEKLHFRYSNAELELIFLADNVPPHSITSFHVTSNKPVIEPEVIIIESQRWKREDLRSVIIGNENLELVFTDGLLTNLKIDNALHYLRQEFCYYEGAAGNNAIFANRSSGAYIFRPNGTEKIVTEKVEIKVFRGEHVEEVQQIFNDWISQVVRVYKNSSHVEFEWLIGPIPVEDNIGKEVITRITTDIASKGVFFTDSNGREMIKRVRDKREDYEPHLEEFVSGNYYPVISKIAIEDNQYRLAILPDRAVGGASIHDGSIEIMLHRRLLHDDAFGVGEALNERAFGEGLVARGKYYLLYGANTENLKMKEVALQVKKHLPFWSFFSDISSLTLNEWKNNYVNNYVSALSKPLPDNVHLLTLEPWDENQLLVRFEYASEVRLPQVSFDIMEYFSSFNIISLRETTLDGAQWLDQTRRLKFTPDSLDSLISNEIHEDTCWSSSSGIISLNPMEIKTFVLYF